MPNICQGHFPQGGWKREILLRNLLINEDDPNRSFSYCPPPRNRRSDLKLPRKAGWKQNLCCCWRSRGLGGLRSCSSSGGHFRRRNLMIQAKFRKRTFSLQTKHLHACSVSHRIILSPAEEKTKWKGTQDNLWCSFFTWTISVAGPEKRVYIMQRTIIMQS